MFIFTKEMAEKLRKIRKTTQLTQKELAMRIGIKSKSGRSVIGQLESGMVKNPTLRTILDYLRACGASWVEFFKELDRIDFKQRHEKMIAQLPIPPEKRKIERDAMRYEIGVEFPSKEKEAIDFTRLKKQIKDKVLVLLTKNQVEENQINSYQRFASEFFGFLAALNKPGMKMVIEKYQRAGLARHLILKIKKIVFSVIGAELKRIEAKKPLPIKKQEKMAIGFTKYRIIIERIETEAHKLLCESGIPTPWFSLYKDFVRECYKVLKKYYGKNPERLARTFKELVRRWQKEGLKEGVLLKLQERVIKVYNNLRMKGIVKG
jgi:transcriptional regulator with XRE-family HTH domain